jgi:anti-sigma regulatory factor (Ser/Thr protein kinase)
MTAELPLASYTPKLESVPEARQAVAEFVAGRVEPEVAEAVELLSSELAANAVTHAGTEYVVSAGLEAGVLTVAVSDGDHAAPVLEEPEAIAESGRGVMLVDTYADRWGVEQLDTGKRVWFELDVHDAQVEEAQDERP